MRPALFTSLTISLLDLAGDGSADRPGEAGDDEEPDLPRPRKDPSLPAADEDAVGDLEDPGSCTVLKKALAGGFAL